MRRQGWTTWGVLAAACAALAAWQYREYRHERDAARQTVERQADAVLSALVGGLRSHRRLGHFFEEQIQAVIEELAAAEDVLAVAVVGKGDDPFLSAGEPLLVPKMVEASRAAPAPPDFSAVAGGSDWLPEGFRLARRFEIERLGGPGGGGPGYGGPGGPGAGRGPGFGRGLGRGAGREDVAEEDDGPLAGGRFTAVLLLDRAAADAQCRRAAWTRLTVAAAGSLVLLSVALVWRATVHLADARGREQLLEVETRHLRELSQAAAGLAHETRNPLGLIRGWAQRLGQSGLQTPEQEQQARAMLEECDRVTSRINQFLTFARPTEPRTERVELAALAEELAALLEPDLEARRLRLSRRIDAPATVPADREMLRQALFNLLQNAVQFSPDGGEVEIRVLSGPGKVRIEVADRGPGVAKESVGSLFTPYFTTRPGGTGLGLALVRRIALAHGWQCGYQPREGGGAVFFVQT
jgi:two-component system, NtrC family, sensor histidine kinase HydH